jgi:peptidyl-prolyl cis-trans isomerase D
MLQQLRDQTQSTGFKILVVAIILVLTLFGFGATNIFLGTVPSVANVGDYEVTENVLAIETERERRRIITQMGPEFDPADIDRLQLQNFALDQLVNRQVLYQATDMLGLAFSDADVNQQLVESPAYQVAGEFNEALYRQQVQMLGFTPPQFIEEVRQGLGSELLRQGVVASGFAQDWEVAQATALLDQRRDIAYLNLDVEKYMDGVDVTEEAIATRYEEDRSVYVTEPTVDVEWVEITLAGLQASADIDDSEEALRDIYDADVSTLIGNSQRASAHILILVDDTTDEASALQQIEAAAERLANGEEFAVLATELSQDPGSAALGGDLGMMTKGSFDSAFEEGLWALEEPGEVSEPVRSEFGYHLIQLKEIGTVEVPTFDEERAGILARLRSEAAADAFDLAMDDLERRAFEERYELTATAAAINATVQTVQGITQQSQDQASPWKYAENPEIIDSLYSPEGLDGENSPVVMVSDGVAVVARVSQYNASEERSLEEVRDSIRESLKLESALSQIEADKLDALSQLQAGDSVSAVATGLGERWQRAELATRAGGTPQGPANIPQAVLNEAFALPRPVSGGKSVGSITGPEGSSLVVVTRVLAGDVDATSEALVDQLAKEVIARDQQLEFAAFFTAAQESVGVSRADN